MESATSARLRVGERGPVLGLATPVVTHNPGLNNPWELDAGVEDLVAIAQQADALGVHHLTCSEHVAYPSERATEPGMGRYWDPLATLSYLAAVTTRIQLATHVLVLPYHHPLAVAKRYGTLDRLSGGRLILGVGVGHLEAEFRLLGAPYEQRGAVTDDALRALRASLGSRRPAYAGSHFRFEDVVVDPHTVQERVPIWVGGRTARSLRRAAELGDGWVPFALDYEDLVRLLAWARDAGIVTADRPRDLVLYAQPRIDPIGAPEETARRLAAYAELGATVCNLRIVHHSRAHALEQLEALASMAPDIT